MHGIMDRLLGGYESGRISRRELLLTLSAVALGAKEVGGAGTTTLEEAGDGRRGQGAPPFRARTLNHTTLFVSDVERSVEFYRDLFGMPVRSRQENGVNLAAGPQNQFLGLYATPSGADPAIHHVCLGVEAFDAEEAVETLDGEGVEARIRMRGPTPELYFTDPDGLTLQVQDVSYCGGGGELGNEC